MFFAPKNKEEHRYYLLPGMGRSNRRRHRQFAIWGVVVGLVVAALLALLIYLIDR